MRKFIPAALKGAVTVLLFSLIFRKVDFQEFAGILGNARPDILLFGFLVLWIGHSMCVLRWRMLMRPLMPIPTLRSLFGVYCIGLFFNLTFPTVIGGDLAKVYYAGRASRRFAQSFAATFLDRDAGMLAMMLIACTAILIYPVQIPGIPIRLVIWSAFCIFLAANLVIFTPALHRRLTSLTTTARISRISKKMTAISEAFLTMGRHGTVLANSLLISLVNQLLVISVTWILAEGLHIHIAPFYFLIFVPVITLISMIPVSLNGMGLREYATVSLLGAIGIARESSVALGLLSSLILYVTAVPGGIAYVLQRTRGDLEQIEALESDY